MDPRLLEIARACKGYLDEAEGLRLYSLAERYGRLGPIVEIGSYCGKSTVYLGAGAQASNSFVVCVDHHRGSDLPLRHAPGGVVKRGAGGDGDYRAAHPRADLHTRQFNR